MHLMRGKKLRVFHRLKVRNERGDVVLLLRSIEGEFVFDGNV